MYNYIKLGGKRIQKMPGSKCLADLGTQVQTKCYFLAVTGAELGSRERQIDLHPLFIQVFFFGVEEYEFFICFGC